MLQITHNFYNKIKDSYLEVPLENYTFFEGKIGLIWYEYYTWKATNERKNLENVTKYISEVFEDVNNDLPNFYGPSYSGGAAGFCYVVNLLHKARLIEITIDEDLADLEEYLYEACLGLIQDKRLDFWHGAFGIIFYFLERLDNPQIRKYTEDLLEKTFEIIVESKEQYWFPNINAEYDKDIINLSLSHGQCSFYIILMQAYYKGLCKDIIPEIIRKGADFISSLIKTPDFDRSQVSFFPQTINIKDGSVKINNRLAICYGDLNIVLFLYQAGEFLEDPQLSHTAELVGLSTLLRQTEKDTLISDPYLCHGSAGVAQFYKTLYTLSGNKSYQDGYQFWIDKTLDLIDKDLATDKTRDASILNGYLGVRLVLLSYISKESLDWEKAFLL